MQSYRSPGIELYGTHGVLQMLGDDWAPEGYELWRNDKAAWEIHPETDPTWPWTDGLRHLVECIETGAEPVTRPEHAYHALEIMLAAQAAGADGRAREITSPFPAPDFARAAATSTATAACTTRSAREPGRRPTPPTSPRPTFDGPTRSARRRHPPRLGRRGGGRGGRLDLRVDRARSTARLRAAAGGALPPLARVPHRLRRRRVAVRARGHARDRQPRDRRGPARRRRARASSSAATPGTTRSRSGRSRCACSSSSRRRRPRARRAPTRGRSRTSRQSRYADDALLGTGRRPRRRARACACCARPTCCGGATSACCAACSSPST